VRKPSDSPTPQNWASGGYLKKAPVDPWGNHYHYLHPGKHGNVDIWSDGPPDSDTQKVIGNWDSNQ
jgi:general secretion pathway protein G